LFERGVKVNARQKRHINRGKNNASPYVTHSNRRKIVKEKPKQELGKQGNATGYECAEQLAQGKSIEVATTTNCKTKCL